MSTTQHYLLKSFGEGQQSYQLASGCAFLLYLRIDLDVHCCYAYFGPLHLENVLVSLVINIHDMLAPDWRPQIITNQSLQLIIWFISSNMLGICLHLTGKIKATNGRAIIYVRFIGQVLHLCI